MGGKGQLPLFRSHDFFSCQNSKLEKISPRVRGMSDNVVEKTVVLRMNKNFMKFLNLNDPWILKQRFPTFGTVISVADNEQDGVEMD